MKNSVRLFYLLILIGIGGPLARANTVEFSAKPTVETTGNKSTIRFSVSATLAMRTTWARTARWSMPKTNRVRPRRTEDPKDMKSPFTKPELAFSWIVGVGVTDKYAYVGDSINQRVLRAKLVYAVEETVPITGQN